MVGGRWHSPSPNWQEKYHLYTTYILPSGGLYATYHLLGEPETTIDLGFHKQKIDDSWVEFQIVLAQEQETNQTCLL